MHNLFGKKKTVQEEARDAKKEIRGQTKACDRQTRDLDRQEAELMKEIKRAAGKGDEAGARTMAQQLIRVRDQKARTQKSKAQIMGVGSRTQQMAVQHKQMETIGATAAVMGKMNAQMDPVAMQRVMQEFSMQNQKMEMAQEVMDDALDGLDDEDMDDETTAVMDAVLDEVGLEIRQGAAVGSAALPQQRAGQAAAAPAAAAARSAA